MQTPYLSYWFVAVVYFAEKNRCESFNFGRRFRSKLASVRSGFCFRQSTFPSRFSNATTSSIDSFFLQLALNEAQQAAREDEVPIGAIVVRNHRVIARQHNRVEQRNDATAHAELLAMRQAARRGGNWRLTNATLYSTLEPCVMCCAAAQAFRVDRIVYGAPDHRLGAIVSHIQLLNVTHPYHTITEVKGGVCSDECGMVMRDFFREKRERKKNKTLARKE